jgi:hypothetical protein
LWRSETLFHLCGRRKRTVHPAASSGCENQVPSPTSTSALDKPSLLQSITLDRYVPMHIYNYRHWICLY